MKNTKTISPTPKQHESIQKAAALHQAGHLEKAAEQYKKLLKALPNNTTLLTNLGTIALQQGKLEEGIRIIGKSLQIAPNQPKALNNRGNALKNLNRLNDAIACYDLAIAIDPEDATAYSNRGVALKDLNRLDEALASFKHAITINPGYVEAYSNCGNVLKELRKLDEALACFDNAIALNPNYADAYLNKSLLKILIGDYEKGWALYEWGWKCSQRKTSMTFTQPLWLGEQSLFNKTILIYPEQGLGDYIQFIRYAALVEQLGAKVILGAPSPLMTIASTLDGQFTLIEKAPIPDFDYHCPVMSLPLAFKTTIHTIPSKIPYLFADNDKQNTWRQILGKKSIPRVGLVFSGSTEHKNDHNRSLAVTQLQSLFNLPIEFHCLQQSIRSDDALFMAENCHVKTHQDMLKDFSDTAALIAEMDLVISVDTSVAHLAGALGKKLWILLPYAPDYRWMLDRTDSPWYPTATLFRQPAVGDWDSVIIQIGNELKKIAGQIQPGE